MKLYPIVACMLLLNLGSVSGQSARELCRICGIRKGSESRIINGTEANRGEIPWRVNVNGCSGVIIHKNWVLTAAHCVDRKDEPDYGVAVGGGSLREYGGNDGQAFYIYPQDIFINENYVKFNPSKGQLAVEGDMALLRIQGDGFDFYHPASWSAPICLPYKLRNRRFSGKVKASGWGLLQPGGRETPEILNKVTLDVYDTEQCNELLYNWKRGWHVTQDKICTNTPNKDICHGDSGGSLDLEEGGRVFNIGVVSHFNGGRWCADETGLTIYCRVSHYLDWIERVTKLQFCGSKGLF